MDRSELSNDNISRKGDPSLKYVLGDVLGEGSYGTVYRGTSLSSNVEFAIKILPFEADGGNLSNIAKEIAILKNLRSPFVVSFHESYLYNNEMWIIMECCRGGSLIDLIEVTNFQEEEIRAVMAYCCLGLTYLHSKKCIHRDIKSGNILLTLNGKAKIADFGVSAQLSSSMMQRKTIIGSPFWMAPDDGKADVWSLGITLYELCTGNPPHFSVSPLRAIFLISSKPAPKLPAKRASHISAAGEMKELDWSEELKDFIGLCLKKDSSKRSTAQELLDHPFIADYVSVINDNESSNTHGYDSDSSGDFEEEETHGLSVLIDLVEENLPALTEKWMGKENNKSKRCESELEKKLSIKSSAVATVRVNRAESFSPRSLSLVQPSSSAVERRPSMDLQWSTPRKSGKAAIGFNSEIVSQHSDQKLSSDDEWMYGLEADSSQSASLYSSVTKREPINLADTFQRKPSMGDKSPQSCRTSFIATTPRENMSNKGANIQSALKCFKETEDCLTAKKLAALPPLDRTLSSPRTLLSPRTIHLAGDLHGSLKHDGSLTPPGRRRLSETSSVAGKVRKSLTPPSRRQSNASTPDDKARKSLTPPCRRQSDASYTSEKARNSLTPPSRRQSIASATSEKVRNSLTPPSRRQSIASATSEKVRNSLTPPSRRQSDASSTSEKARNSLTPPSRRQSIASAISEKVRNSLTPPTGRRLSDPATVSDKGRRNLIPPGRRLSDPASVVEKARESKTFFLTALDATQRPSTYLEAFSANEPLDFMHNPYNSSAGIASKNGTGIASKTGTGIASKRGTGSLSKAGSKSLSGTGTGTGTASGASTVCVSGIGIGVDSKAGCRTSQDIHRLLNELEIEHKTTIYELEAAYEAKRRNLLRKMKNLKEPAK